MKNKPQILISSVYPFTRWWHKNKAHVFYFCWCFVIPKKQKLLQDGRHAIKNPIWSVIYMVYFLVKECVNHMAFERKGASCEWFWIFHHLVRCASKYLRDAAFVSRRKYQVILCFRNDSHCAFLALLPTRFVRLSVIPCY